MNPNISIHFDELLLIVFDFLNILLLLLFYDLFLSLLYKQFHMNYFQDDLILYNPSKFHITLPYLYQKNKKIFK